MHLPRFVDRPRGRRLTIRSRQRSTAQHKQARAGPRHSDRGPRGGNGHTPFTTTNTPFWPAAARSHVVRDPPGDTAGGTHSDQALFRAGRWRAGQVGGHDLGRSPVEGERREQHPPVSHRDQVGLPGQVLLIQQPDQVGPVASGVAGWRCSAAGLLAACSAFLDARVATRSPAIGSVLSCPSVPLGLQGMTSTMMIGSCTPNQARQIRGLEGSRRGCPGRLPRQPGSACP
jgi:hypothetical protein